MALDDFVTEKPVLDTARLRLRPMTEADVPALREWTAEESLYTYWGKGPGRTDRDPSLLFTGTGRPVRSFHLGIEEKSAGRVIGEIWVYRIVRDRMASVALRIAPSFQGNGFGAEALGAMTRFCFDHTELQRLQAETDVRNTASQRTLEACGYRKEGRIRRGRMVSVWCDYYVYSMLRDDLDAVCERIRRMEVRYDALTRVLKEEPVSGTAAMRKNAETLSAYLSGRWKTDYLLDELGLLPKNLKRGVLSQDGLYDLLSAPEISALLRGDLPQS